MSADKSLSVAWGRTDGEGRTVSVIATPSRVIDGEAVFEITESALGLLLTEAGFIKSEVLS